MPVRQAVKKHSLFIYITDISVSIIVSLKIKGFLGESNHHGIISVSTFTVYKAILLHEFKNAIISLLV